MKTLRLLYIHRNFQKVYLYTLAFVHWGLCMGATSFTYFFTVRDSPADLFNRSTKAVP